MKRKLIGMLTLFLALVVQVSYAQEKTISGTVTDDTGLPLPGVNIVVKDTNNGTQTDFDGKYSISASQGDILVFSYVGFADQNKTVGAGNTMDVQLQAAASELDEVVVIGYGQQSKKEIVQNISVIDSETIERIPVVSTDQLLQGNSSGVQVVTSTGVLGGNSVIRVRGVGSITGGSQPLIVVDGVPLTDTDNTFGRGGNTGLSPLSYINPNDIESFSVLKDAGATSIYGSRGANGVILITTKKGRKNTEAQVSLDVWTQVSQATDLIDILDADGYRKFKSDIATIQNNGVFVAPENVPGRNLGAFGDPGTDWVDGVTRTAFTKNYDLNVRGGSEKTSYFLGAGYYQGTGIVIGNDLDRISAKLSVDTEASDWLKAGLNMNITNTQSDRVAVDNNTAAPLTSAFLQDPTILAFDSEGNFRQSPSFIPNIFAQEALDIDDLKTFRFIGNGYLDISITPNLTFRPEIGADRVQVEEALRFADFNTPGGSATLLQITEERWFTNQILRYNNKFGDHSLAVLAGLNYEETLRTFSQVTANGFISDVLRNIGSGATPTIDAGERDPSRLYGLFSRLTYDYKSKYLFEGSIRRDGSTRFGRNNRFGVFWSLSAGWNIAEEEFLRNSEIVSDLKLRASIGTVGNDRLGTFPSLGLFVAGADGDFNGQSGIIPNQPSNPDLKWEESQTIDVGIQSSFFNNRLGLNVTYFKKTTEDLLLAQALPPQTGFNTINRNTGAIENSGWEVDFNASPIETKDFSWNINLNVSAIDTEVTKLNEDAATDEQGRKFLDAGAQRAIEGESLNEFFLIRFVGINSQTGDAEWLDKDGNITNNPTADDRVQAGQALPDFSGGITNNFKYKNFDLSVFFNFSYGNDVLFDGLRFIDGADAIGGIGNVRAQNANIWRNPGDNAFLPSPNSPTFNLFNQRSTQQLVDGSYLRLKNLQLGYNLPQNLLDRVKIISNARVYATATNLFTIKAADAEGLDPEVSDDSDPRFQGESFFTAPQAKTYLLGVQLTF